MIKPNILRVGSTISIVSPSAGVAALFPHRVRRGEASLASVGLKTEMAVHSLSRHGHVSDTAPNRAADIHEALRNPSISAILATIGGNHSCQLLPHLDFDLFVAHPKPFVGYSDITVLLLAIFATTGLVTFHGPTLLTDWAEYPVVPEYTCDRFAQVLMSTAIPGELPPSLYHIDEFVEWGSDKDRVHKKPRIGSQGWTCLQKGTAQGRLMGGCLEAIQRLKGTQYWPNWDGAVAFFETSSNEPNIPDLDALFSDLSNLGVLKSISGLVLGRKAWPEKTIRELHHLVLDYCGTFGYPLLVDVDFGHVSPMLTLPIGCMSYLDATNRRLSITEPAVVDAFT